MSGNGRRGKPDCRVPRGNRVSLLLLIGVAAALLVVAGGCVFSGEKPREFVYSRLLMDTNVELKLVCSSRQEAERLRDAVFSEMERLETLFSRNLPDSEINHINRWSGERPVAVDPAVIKVLQETLGFSELSDGAFDPTIAPLLDAWGFLDGEYRVPSASELEAARSLVSYHLLELDAEQNTAYLAMPGMALDLGGIAKGYIVDRGLAILAEAGVKHAFLNAGGDIGLIGTRPDGTPWRIGVRHPRTADAGDLAAVIPLADRAVVTSGDYQRAFEKDGQYFHHIIDPETGYPARGLASVTVVAPTVMEADALSTAIFVLGADRGMALVESLPEVEAILVTPGLEVSVSSGLQKEAEILLK